MGTEKEKLNRALNYYLSGPSRAENTLITCELGWGGFFGCESCEKGGEMCLSALIFGITSRKSEVKHY